MHLSKALLPSGSFSDHLGLGYSPAAGRGWALGAAGKPDVSGRRKQQSRAHVRRSGEGVRGGGYSLGKGVGWECRRNSDKANGWNEQSQEAGVPGAGQGRTHLSPGLACALRLLSYQEGVLMGQGGLHLPGLGWLPTAGHGFGDSPKNPSHPRGDVIVRGAELMFSGESWE